MLHIVKKLIIPIFILMLGTACRKAVLAPENPSQAIYATYGENIAEGYANENDVMVGWIKSPGHCQHIMDGDFTQMGVAITGKYWTQVFSAH